MRTAAAKGHADFLARFENRPERFAQIFKEICETKVEDDGLRFDPATVTAERIAEDADYQGIRVRFFAYLENARIPFQVDPRPVHIINCVTTVTGRQHALLNALP